jgi:hypothetical protein
MTIRSQVGFLSVALAAVCAAGTWEARVAVAEEDFRIENEVFVEGDKEPRIRSTTIFHDGVVYDYLEEPSEVTVFDAQRGRFILLDLDRRIKTELTTGLVAGFTDRLRRWSREQSDPFLQFLGDPEFEQTIDQGAGELTFSSPWMTYRLVTFDTESEALSRRYREFCDWYCQLNTVLNPGTKPPFARMMVNEALEEHGLFPREVHLTMRPKGGLLSKRTNVRSEHRLIRQLVESDRQRVAQTHQFMAMYTSVEFPEYQRKLAE